MSRHAAAWLAGAVLGALAPAQTAATAIQSGLVQSGMGKMWTFHDPPLAYLQREYGFAPDQRWLDTVRLASLVFGNGCSASFVSPKGLILTNQHCVREALVRSQQDADWLRDGFVAAGFEQEARLLGVAVRQLVKMTDVTARIEATVQGSDAPAAAAKKRAANEQAVLAQAQQDEPSLRAEVVALFQGAVQQLYQYRVFDDVRLVMAPHLQAAHFGGDPDNFVYPRYGIDFAFCRAWVEGKPADTSGCCFGFSDGPRRDQLVFLAGSPGRTQRHLTMAQLEHRRDDRYPRLRQMFDHRLDIMQRAAAKDPEQERLLRSRILWLENGQKLYRGEHEALLDAAFMQRKADAEAALRAMVAARPSLQARSGDLWERIAAATAERRRVEVLASFHHSGGWPLLARGLQLVEFAACGDRHVAARARKIPAARDPVQEELFVDHLLRAQQHLPAGDPYLAALLPDGADPAAVVRRLAASRLGDDAALDQWIAAGPQAVAALDDPCLALARTLQPVVAATQKEMERLVERERALDTELGRVVFACYGNTVSSEATFSPRFSDGRVRGYPCNGTVAPWRTVFHGMFARNAEFDGRPPFDLPEAWLLAKDRIDLRAGVNFVCTVDATGGNSGSAIIDQELRLVGVLFDGNIESLRNEFLYGEEVERSVCVHPQAIVEALTRVYPGAHIVDELRRR